MASRDMLVVVEKGICELASDEPRYACDEMMHGMRNFYPETGFAHSHCMQICPTIS